MSSSSLSASRLYNSAKATRVAFVCAILVILGSLMLLQSVAAMQLVDQTGGDQASIRTGPTASLAIVEYPEITARVLENLLHSIVYSANANEFQSNNNGVQKRGLDLGISRGFSGSQAGKHLMGLSAASFANGPGR